MIFRRSRFQELVELQLDLFESDTDLLDEAVEADAAWTNASADEAEELYGDYQLVVDAIGDRLDEIRDTYAASLEESAATEYRSAYQRAVNRRLGRYWTYVDDDA